MLASGTSSRSSFICVSRWIPTRLNGCGLLVINPPYRFEDPGRPDRATPCLRGLGASETGRRHSNSCGSPMSKIAIVGAGAWGTALALQAIRAGHDVTLVARDAATAGHIRRNRANPRLPSVSLPEARRASPTLLPDDSALILMAGADAAPSRRSSLRIAADGADRRVREGRRGRHASAAAGSGRRSVALPVRWRSSPARISPTRSPPACPRPLSWPAPMPASASTSAPRWARQRVSLYGNDDPIGAQLGGAAKNVIAIAAGAVIGAGLGENARAALITRGLAELSPLDRCTWRASGNRDGPVRSGRSAADLHRAIQP